MSNIEKIRQEIERLKIAYLNRSYTFVPATMEQLLDFIDSLPEEKPSEGKEYSSPECGTAAGVWSEEEAGNTLPCNVRLTEIREIIRKAKDGFDPFNRKRDTKSVFWRQAIMMQLRREGFSLHQVGRAAGYNHSTVKFSTERVTDAMQGYDQDLLNVWLELQRVIQTQRDK